MKEGVKEGALSHQKRAESHLVRLLRQTEPVDEVSEELSETKLKSKRLCKTNSINSQKNQQQP